MTTKENIISDILKKELKGLKNLMDDNQKQLDSIRKKGFDKEIHPGNHNDILTGLSHTIGYCTSKLQMTKDVIGLMKLDVSGLNKLIKENKKIEKQNKKTLDSVFGIFKSKKKSLEKIREKQWNRKKPKRILRTHPLSDPKIEKKVEEVIRNLNKKK